MCEPKAGTLVGTDYTGNKYFENNREQAGRNRWVDYAQVSCLALAIQASIERWFAQGSIS
jgi:NADH:ubiquinone oxidoreductase subunit